VGIFVTLFVLVHSRMGLAFQAIREDELAAQTLGLNTVKYKLFNFTMGCFLGGILGAFYAHYLGVLAPTPEEFGVPRTVEILTITYVGGRGTLWGSIFAAFVLIGFQEYFRPLGTWRLVMFGSLLILTILIAPKGLAPLWRRLW
jgi:branched-chain amino acid transport system permease protein